MKNIRLGVDVGGTFTDLVAIVDGQVLTAKVPSTQIQSEGVFQAFARTELDPETIAVFTHGMTVATNALLEGKGAKTAFITTAGFRDILLIGRQNRPHLYDLRLQKPKPLVQRDHCLTLDERMGSEGVLRLLHSESLEALIATLQEWITQEEIESIAVGFLFSFRFPQHEQQVAKALRKAFPNLHLSLSSDITPEFREYERFSTTVVDAYLSPGLARYLGLLAEGCRTSGLPIPKIMQSSGGVTTIEQASQHGALALLSGPAGGVNGAHFVAQQSGFAHVLTFDMGGTSTDVSLILEGQPQASTEALVAGYPVRLPQIDIHTVSAGGGSIAWIDPGGALKVGPQSAGSLPGPVAYGRGGKQPTITDANVFLGYLEDGAMLGGSVRIDRSAAAAALEKLGESLGLSAERIAIGMRAIANAHMCAALRVMSIERGIDPRRLALLAFGGAGPMHACDLATALGIRTVLVPRAGGVLSALGLAVSPLREDYSCSVLKTLPEVGEVWVSLCENLAVRASHALAIHSFSADLRYRGQSFELAVPVTKEMPYSTLADAFHSLHNQRYGWSDPSQTIEVVQLRLAATEPLELPNLTVSKPTKQRVSMPRLAWFDAQFQSIQVWQGLALGEGDCIDGPALIELPEATVIIPPGWHSTVDLCGTLVIKMSRNHEDISTI
ncbi:MAG: hydantoinase/oxoprolinase family protein [Anaerolineae bacterium]|nr:hydantoinase/oxoprolinase family protein [Gloeobacterales cyanobacterium ES-bin-313]